MKDARSCRLCQRHDRKGRYMLLDMSSVVPTINKIMEGIEEYRLKTGNEPIMITITKHIESRIRLEIEEDNNLPKIYGIPLNVISGNSTAITYES